MPEIDKTNILTCNINLIFGVFSEKYTESEVEMIDLLLGGSPCQGFSSAGKQLNFLDPRSKLFFNYVKALETLKPRYFLLENVKMKKEYQDIISKYMGVEPIEINSALVSAQKRKRLYWTNIPNITIPNNKNIALNDILQEDIEHTFLPLYRQEYTNYDAGKVNKEINPITAMQLRSSKQFTCSVSNDGKAFTVRRTECNGILDKDYRIRQFTPIEVERLQTVPDDYTSCLCKTKRYEALGNGWTADVIAHILSFIPNTYLHTVLSLFDGISCGQVALEKAGKIYNQYYASEIDKYAIQVAMKNYPHTMQLGDVTQIDWTVFFDKINMIQKVS